jgi:hypothetical protein
MCSVRANNQSVVMVYRPSDFVLVSSDLRQNSSHFPTLGQLLGTSPPPHQGLRLRIFDAGQGVSTPGHKDPLTSN